MKIESTELTEHFAAWHDEDLVRALKMQRDDYEDSYLDSISAELDRRQVDIASFINRVQVSYNNEPPLTLSAGAAMEKVDEDFPLWHALAFTHYFGSTLVVQRELDSWMVNAYAEDTYVYSFFVADRTALCQLLHLFLALDAWEHLADETHNLDGWKALLRTRSARYVQKVCQALSAQNLVSAVQTPVFTHDQRGNLALLVAELETAENVLHDLQDHVLNLYRQADEALTQNNLTRELGLYTELTDYGLNNPAVYYNLGSGLFESGRFDEAAIAFIEAASLSLTELDPQVQFQMKRGPGGLGGIFGIVSMLVSVFKSDEPGSANALREVPDHIEDIELFLLRLLDHLPQNLQILHSLASIAAIRHDVPLAIERYRKILALAPEDETAQQFLAEQQGQ